MEIYVAFRVQIAQAYFVSCYKNQLIRAVRVNNYRESWIGNKCSVLNLRGLKRYIKLPRSCKCELSGGLWWNLTVGICFEGFSAEFRFGQYRLGINLASFRFWYLIKERKSRYQFFFFFCTFWIFSFVFASVRGTSGLTCQPCRVCVSGTYHNCTKFAVKFKTIYPLVTHLLCCRTVLFMRAT